MTSKIVTDKLHAVAFAQATRAMDMYTQAVRRRAEQDAEAAAAAKAREELARAAEEARQLAVEAEQQRQEAIRNEVNFIGDPNKLNGILAAFRSGDEARRSDIRAQYDRAIELHTEADAKIDFARLPYHGRLMFLPVYLGLTVGKDYPRLDLDRSEPDKGVLIFNTHYGPADAALWRERLPLINRYIGGTWATTELDGTSISLWRRPELPDVIPMTPDLFRHGEVFFGFDMMTGKPYYVPLAKMTHTLVGGQSGVGKSVMLNQVLRSMLFNLDCIDELILVDLKRVELSRYDGLSPKITVVRTYEELPAIVERVLATMYRRLSELESKGDLTVKSGFTILVIDEYASIEQHVANGKEETAAKKALTANLVKLSQLGRAAGIRLWAQLQKPTTDNMDSSFRTNLQSVACFYMPSKVNATQMFGDLDGLPADPTDLNRGEFVFQDDGQNRTVHLKSALCDEHDIAGLKAAVHPGYRSTALDNGGPDDQT